MHTQVQTMVFGSRGGQVAAALGDPNPSPKPKSGGPRPNTLLSPSGFRARCPFCLKEGAGGGGWEGVLICLFVALGSRFWFWVCDKVLTAR